MASTLVPLLLLLILCVVQSKSSDQCFSSNTKAHRSINELKVGEDVRTLIDGSLKFSFNLLRTLTTHTPSNADTKGIFFSPYSIWSALMVTLMGAQGKSEVELRSILGTSNANKEVIWGAFNNIHKPERDSPPGSSGYRIANRVFFQTGTDIRKCVKQMIDTDIGFTDYSKNPEAAAKEINDWVSGQTENKIQELVPRGAINAFTKMVIANAVYFKENWQTQFDPAQTKRARFTLSNRNDIFVHMMKLRGRYLYGISEELQCTALELPYANGGVSMLILLPNNRFYGVNTVANKLTQQRLSELLLDMYPREVIVSLPKFQIDDNFELSQTLNKMGLRTIFDTNQADLSDFTGRKEFSVDAVQHKSFINVTEEGTEAAAATAIISSRSARPLGPASFQADYPFIFLIKDTISEVILFMGTVQKPTEFSR